MKNYLRLAYFLLIGIWPALSWSQPIYLADLGSRVPQAEGERVEIIGGIAVATRLPINHRALVSDDILISIVPSTTPEHRQWAWVREGIIGKDFNTDSAPIELNWLPFSPGNDIAPHLINLRNNWGNTLIWRPAPVDAVMSYIDWGQIHILKMKAPSRNITIKNVPSSDGGHLSTLGEPGLKVSHHRMWHFPHPPTGALEIGEENSSFKVTFTDASFDPDHPWRWNEGSKWSVQAGACINPDYRPGSRNKQHASYYKNIRWYSKSGLIDLLVPGNGRKEYPEQGISVRLHSNFKHIWGNALYARSVPAAKRDHKGRPNLHYHPQRAGANALRLEISGDYYDAGITFRAHERFHPVQDLWLKNVVIADPYSLGTDYPGIGPAKSQLDGDCSTVTGPGLALGVYGTARGSVEFRYGAAGLTGYLARDLHGEDPAQPFHITYTDIGYTAEANAKLAWDARKCCIPKIDGFAPANSKHYKLASPIRLEIEVNGKFKKHRVHAPLAIEWGDDDSAGVDIYRDVIVSLRNGMLHFYPAPPLIPPTHFPKTQSARITVKTTHDITEVKGNPWLRFYSNMTLAQNSVIPYSLVVLGAMDEKIPKGIDSNNTGQSFIADGITVLNNPKSYHNSPGDAPVKIRLGSSNWAPPKYCWFKGKVVFENVVKNGEFLYSPAWGNHQWTLRIDQPLQPGVKISLGPAQKYTGKTLENSTWHKGQLTQSGAASGAAHSYYMALKNNIGKHSDVNNRSLWRKIDNPFDSMTLIYRGKSYRLPNAGAVVGQNAELLYGDRPDHAIAPIQ